MIRRPATQSRPLQAYLELRVSKYCFRRDIPSAVNTSFDHINPNVLNTSLDLLSHERRWSFMDPINTLGILSSESRRGGHGVAAVCRYDFLIGLESPACLSLALLCVCGMASGSLSPGVFTHAPPELSEPAITRMRFILVVGLNMVFPMFLFKARSHIIAT